MKWFYYLSFVVIVSLFIAIEIPSIEKVFGIVSTAGIIDNFMKGEY